MKTLAILLALALCSCQAPQSKNKFDPYGVPPSQSMAESLSARAIRALVRDYESFQYRGVSKPVADYLYNGDADGRRSKHGGYRVELEVNGRNLVAGYVGFVRAEVFLRNGRYYHVRIWNPGPGAGSRKWRLIEEWERAYQEELDGMTRGSQIAEDVLARLEVKTLAD